VVPGVSGSKFRGARADTLQVQLPGNRHHAVADACHIEVILRHASPHLDPHVFSDRASLVRNTGAALGGHLVRRGTDRGFEALVRWQGWRNQDGSIGRLRPIAFAPGNPSSAFGISARLTGKIRTSYSRLLRRTAVSPYPLLFLWLSISGRQQKQREFLSKTVKGSAFIICVTHLATGL
jgi:hypothetical protein